MGNDELRVFVWLFVGILNAVVAGINIKKGSYGWAGCGIFVSVFAAIEIAILMANIP